jgi:5-methylcytosine-specific restriction endonuclease McrA
LPPSLQSRTDNIKNIIKKLRKICPITDISYEDCKFDTQLLQNPDIKGSEYQHGTLHGYNLKQYLLEEYSYTCCYCGATNVPLEIEHIIPVKRGGSNRASNLCISCVPCNKAKGNLTAEEFGYPNIQSKVKKSLKDPAYMNSTKTRIIHDLESTGLKIEYGSGALTKFNRKRLGLAKAHFLDACSIGESTPDYLIFKVSSLLHITATGRGSHCRTLVNSSGFPRSYLPRGKYYYGFKTGDMVKATIKRGKYQGTHEGRVTCRSSGTFLIVTKDARAETNYKNVELIQRNNGYDYQVKGFRLLRSRYPKEQAS